MALPTKTRTWTYQIINGRYGSTQVADYYLAIKNALKLVPGATVRGSSNATAAANVGDGVDRWNTTADIQSLVTNYSWITIRFANMGNAELTWAMHTNGIIAGVWYFSPGGLYTGGTVSAKPTATDEITLGFSGGFDTNTSFDRLINVAFTSDGQDLWFLTAWQSAWQRGMRLQMSTSAVVAPAARTGPVAYNFSGSPASWNAYGSFYSRFNGASGGIAGASGNVSGSSFLVLSYETANNQSPLTVVTPVAELQGGVGLIQPLGLICNQSPRRGKLCNLNDWWITDDSVPDGNTYPSNGDREFVQVGPWMWPWNGAPGSPGTNPQLL